MKAPAEHSKDAERMGMIFAAALHGGGLVVCSFCGAWLRINRELGTGSLSHGVCDPVCAPAQSMGWGESISDGASLTSLSGGPSPVSPAVEVCCKTDAGVSSDPRPLIAPAMGARPKLSVETTAVHGPSSGFFSRFPGGGFSDGGEV